MAEKKNKKNKNKKGGIINKILSFFCGLAAIVTMVIGIYDCCSSLPPTLTIHYNGNVVANGVSRNVLVCVDDTTNAESYEPLFPVISNTTSRTAKEFALTYTMTVDNVEFMPRRSYFNQYPEGNNTFTLKYTETSLQPQITTKEPLGLLKLKGNTGVLKSSAFATHEGVKKPYKFNSTAKFLYVDSKNLDSKRWKNACRNAILNIEDIPFLPDYIETDIFFYSSVHGISSELGRHLFYTKEVPDMANADTFTVVPQGASGEIVASLETPILSDTIGIIGSRYKKNVWAGDSIEVTIDNGYKNDTTLYAVLHFQNLSTDFIEAKFMPVVLKSGENEFAFVVDNNQKFIGCTFISESQYDDIYGGENLSEKLLNNVITKDVLRRIVLFLFPILLSILASLLYSYYKDDEDVKDDDNVNENDNKKLFKDKVEKAFSIAMSLPMEERRKILEFVMEHRDELASDPNMELLWGIGRKNLEYIKSAIEHGGNVDITFKEIEKKYREDFEHYKDTNQKQKYVQEETVKNEDKKDTENGNDIPTLYRLFTTKMVRAFYKATKMPTEEKANIIMFLDFLILEMSVKDPDVLMLYAIISQDKDLATKAFLRGGHVDITFEEILFRYGMDTKHISTVVKNMASTSKDEEFKEVK